MPWPSNGTRAKSVLIAASIGSLLVASRSPGQAAHLAVQRTASQEPVELYQGPRPKHIELPECRRGSRTGDPKTCSTLRDGSEGWADVNFMVDPTGKPFEVTVIRSTGNKEVEAMAIKAIQASTFVPASLNGKPIESGLELKFKLLDQGLYYGAKREFIAAYETLVKAVNADDRAAADAAMQGLKITNLYEDASYGMATYLYAKKWGDETQQLDGLLRAIAEEKDAHFLPSNMFKLALRVSMQLQVQMRLYAEALATFEKLQKLGMDKDTAARLTPVVEQLKQLRSDDAAYEITGAMPEGNWHLHLFKRHFRAKVSEGYISQVKLRCEKHYIFFAFDPGLEYQVASKDGDCWMELLGAPGTRFELTQF